MIKKVVATIYALVILTIGFPGMLKADTISIFCDTTVGQIKFAAGDVKAALEDKLFTVEILSLDSLTTSYANKKIVIALSTDTSITAILANQGGTTPTGLGEQAYGLRTTTSPEKSYWAIGGDKNGAMYGGLEIAENILFNGFSNTFNKDESPKILKRGIKLNLAFDAESPTYFSSNESTAAKNAIANVWDTTFWKTWFDEMARYRYNVLSIWNNHPFTSMIKMTDYPNVAISNVTGYSDIYNVNSSKTVIKTMTIDEKIKFWRKIMTYAKERGFAFYLFNWNVFLSNADGQYNMTDGAEGVTNQATINYLRKCMYELLKTYPDLGGFGVTEGEGMSNSDANNSLFLSNTFGKGMADFAKDFPSRKLNFIHRWHMADFTLIKQNFSELLACPNVTFDMSYKYSSAHMYSSSDPQTFSAANIKALTDNNLKTWFTVRNDDFFYHNWGDPNYAREYINHIPGQGEWFTGFYIGSDGFHQTRTFFSKNSVTQGQLEIQRLWYMNMLWGRLAYSPNTSDDVFKNYMTAKYPGVTSNDLFTAWQKASSGLPKVGEIIFGSLNLDFEWYPENCQSDDGFLTIADFTAATPRSSSTLCSITASASNTCGGKTSTYAMADQIEADALAALTYANTMNEPANSELGVTVNTIRAMSYLTIYYAHKIRGATYNKASNKKAEAISELSSAYCWWLKYTNLMDSMYTGMTCQRSAKFETWHEHDLAVRSEYTNIGGTGAPICGNTSYSLTLTSNDATKGTVLGAGLYNPGDIAIVTAVPASGHRFLYWKEGSSVISTDIKYSFTINTNKALVAHFVETKTCYLPWNDIGFTVNGKSVTKIYDSIRIYCALEAGVTISVNLEGLGADNSDNCAVTYKVDGGAYVAIANLSGSFSARTVSVSGVKGNYLTIKISSTTSSSDEFYFIKNIKVDGAFDPNIPAPPPPPPVPSDISVDKLADKPVNIYPNPVSGILNIEFEDASTHREINLFNNVGQQVYSLKTKDAKTQIDIQALNLKGVVMVQVVDGEQVSNHKIIVN